MVSARGPATDLAARDLGEFDDLIKPLLLVAAKANTQVGQRVSASQLQALLILEEGGPLNLSGLAEAMGLLPSSATRLCDRLVAAGLVRRRTGQTDRRAVHLILTVSANRLLLEVRTHRRDALRAALEGLTGREHENLLRGLRALARQLAKEPDSLSDAVNH